MRCKPPCESNIWIYHLTQIPSLPANSNCHMHQISLTTLALMSTPLFDCWLSGTLSWFLSAIQKTLNAHVPPLARSHINLKCPPSYISSNSQLLESFNFSIKGIIQKCSNTELGYGSDFLPAATLEALLTHRSNKTCVKFILTSGFTTNFRHFPDSHRRK